MQKSTKGLHHKCSLRYQEKWGRLNRVNASTAGLSWKDVAFISGVQQLPPSTRHGQQQDPSPPAGVHLQGKTMLPKTHKDSAMLSLAPTGPCLSLAALET